VTLTLTYVAYPVAGCWHAAHTCKGWLPPAPQVYLYGANVVSWKQPTPGGEEVLYVRPDAVFDKSKPISGGIPHCFPVFGPAPAPMAQHGFARQSDWTVTNTSADQQPDERDPEVELVLTDNEYTRSMWYALTCTSVKHHHLYKLVS